VRVRGVTDSSTCDPSVTLPDSFQQLSRLMQFPEEVAIQLTDVEHRLFSRVSAVDYVRLVSSDLTKQPLTLPTSSASDAAKPHPTVSDLILRFQQVSIAYYHLTAVVCMLLSKTSSGRFSKHYEVKVSLWRGEPMHTSIRAGRADDTGKRRCI